MPDPRLLAARCRDVFREVCAALEFRQNQQQGDEVAKLRSGQLLGIDLCPHGRLELAGDVIDLLVSVDDRASHSGLPAEQGLCRSSKRLGDEREELRNPSIYLAHCCSPVIFLTLTSDALPGSPDGRCRVRKATRPAL